GAPINSFLIPLANGPGGAGGIVGSGGNLWVVTNANYAIGEYNAATGAPIDASFITFPGRQGGGLALFGGNFFVIIAGSIAEYDATTGAVVNAALVSGLNGPWSIAVVAPPCTPPVIQSITASPNSIWPPNHTMVPVGVSVQATATCGIASETIVSVSSNESGS